MPSGAADHHMVGAGESLRRHDLARERAEAALHSVADDRSADLLGDGESDAHRRIVIVAVADEKHKAGVAARLPASRPGSPPASMVLSAELLAAAAAAGVQHLAAADVAMRARKPCRRLRTRLLG